MVVIGLCGFSVRRLFCLLCKSFRTFCRLFEFFAVVGINCDCSRVVILDYSAPLNTVRVKLYKGNVIVVGRDSKTDSLFDSTIATFEDDAGAYDQKDAAGFIKLNALRLRIAANLRARKSR